jgi:hypothetical protein
MIPLLRAAVVAYGAVLAWHLATASMAAALGLSFRAAATADLGLPLIFGACGYLWARATGRMRIGVAAALAAGLSHGTLGWRIAVAIRGGGLPGGEDHAYARQEFVVQWLAVALYAGVAGAAAAWLQARLRARRMARGANG